MPGASKKIPKETDPTYNPAWEGMEKRYFLAGQEAEAVFSEEAGESC